MFRYLLPVTILLFCMYSIIPTIILRLTNRLSKSDKVNNKDNIIYLTFDDGPNIRYTEKLLDLLLRYQIKATFFVVAEFASINPTIISRMKMEGHCIGLHSLKHKNQMLQTPNMAAKDFSTSINTLKSLGVNPKFFRPPWGHISLASIYYAKKYDMKTVLWSVIVQDWEAKTQDYIIARKLLDRVSQKDIVCLHDGRGKNNAPLKTIMALEKMLPIWIEQGYKFGRIDDYFEEKAEYKRHC